MFEQKSVLITGGTGSLGQALVQHIVTQYPKFKRLVVFSRDEQKQFEMARRYPNSDYPNIRFFIGDIRDADRLRRALHGIDYVIHTAALKHVSIAEYNPMECIKTNVIGAENLIQCALETSVESVVALSTDKAAAPINLYGASKLASDKLFIAANNIVGERKIRFMVVRYGNVMGSNGSVIPIFMSARKSGVLPITDLEMTRFNITLSEGVEMIMYALFQGWGGEIFVPKIPSFKIVDLAKAIGPDCELKPIGMRPGEKVHEEMITVSDSLYTVDLGPYYAILPPKPQKWKIEDFNAEFGATPVSRDFSFASNRNDKWETVESLREKIRSHVDPDFGNLK